MRRSKLMYLALCALLICLLIPGLIQGTKRGENAVHNNPYSKLPPMLTIGPETDSYELTQREQAKLFLVTQGLDVPPNPQYVNKATIATTGEYSGMTDAELKKLQQDHGVKTNAVPLPDKECISTIDLIPRAAGAEGMTESEKSKLEEWKKMRRGSK